MNPCKLLASLLLALAAGCAQSPPEPEGTNRQPAASVVDGTEEADDEAEAASDPEAPPAAGADPAPAPVAQPTAKEEAEMAACIQEKQQILRGMSGLLARHQSGCRSDDECVLVDTSISCQDNCQMAVFAPSATSFRHELEKFDHAACPSASDRCGIAGQCAEITGAQCVSGVCRPVVAGLGGARPPSK